MVENNIELKMVTIGNFTDDDAAIAHHIAKIENCQVLAIIYTDSSVYSVAECATQNDIFWLLFGGCRHQRFHVTDIGEALQILVADENQIS